MKKVPFLRWCLLIIFLLCAFFIMVKLGYLAAVLSTSVGVAIVSLIGFVFLFTSFRLGVTTFNLEKFSNAVDKKDKKKELKKIEKNLLLSEFSQSLSTGLGFLGTICGLVMMFIGIGAEIDLSNFDTAMNLMKTISAGFGTALYTTLVGLLSAILLYVQSFNIEYESKSE